MIGPLLQLLDQGAVEATSHDIFLTLLSFGLSNNDEQLPPFQTEV